MKNWITNEWITEEVQTVMMKVETTRHHQESSANLSETDTEMTEKSEG